VSLFSATPAEQQGFQYVSHFPIRAPFTDFIRQKVAKISHRNLIANVMQSTLFEERGRTYLMGPNARMVVLGILPHSHIYGVMYISHLHTYRGDSIIVFPKFDMQQMLSCVPQYKMDVLMIVPPIIVAMSKSPDLLK
jgi:acyl-CoA synthetase (AMP-forming)/AMP-acid ligase II